MADDELDFPAADPSADGIPALPAADAGADGADQGGDLLGLWGGDQPAADGAAGTPAFAAAGASGGDDLDAFGLGAPEAEQKGESALDKWNAEHAVVLQGKASKEQQDKAASAAKAKEELAAFYVKQGDTLKRAQAQNRGEEKSWRADLATTNASGTEWEKVAKYCDLKPKADAKAGKTDRMRKLIIALKNDK